MNTHPPVAARLAQALARHAVRISPPQRAQWSRAMANEMDHLPTQASKLAWAFNCLAVSYTERVRIMSRNILSLSRWVLALEMLLCFLPLTGMCYAVIVTAFYGFYQPLNAVLLCAATAVGPYGLFITVRHGILGRAVKSRLTPPLLCGLALWNLLAYTSQFAGQGAPLSAWREVLLCAVFPALGSFHLWNILAPRRTALAVS
jgi:hypothetical protein